MAAISLESVCKSFGNLKAVDNLTLEIAEGETYGFLGTNGAGKTTTIKMLLGFETPDRGDVSILGASPQCPDTRRHLGYLPEAAYYYPYLNIHELLLFYGGLCGMSRSQIIRRSAMLIEEVGLGHAAKRLLRHYSKGMLQRAGIAQALLHSPKLLILDEPFTGLDPLARIHFRDLFQKLRSQGVTIFFSSHELSEAELICDRVGILKQGTLVWSGSVSDAAGDGHQNLERIFLRLLSEKGGGQ